MLQQCANYILENASDHTAVVSGLGIQPWGDGSGTARRQPRPWNLGNFILVCKLAEPWFGVWDVQMQRCFHHMFIVDCFQDCAVCIYIIDWWMVVTWAGCRLLYLYVRVDWAALRKLKPTCSVFHLLTLF
jgi:hypothetical protein